MDSINSFMFKSIGYMKKEIISNFFLMHITIIFKSTMKFWLKVVQEVLKVVQKSTKVAAVYGRAIDKPTSCSMKILTDFLQSHSTSGFLYEVIC